MEKRLSIIANIAIIVVACVAVFGLVRNELARRAVMRQPTRPSPQVMVGKQFPIQQSWSSYNKTAVLVLGVGCHFCTESAPFYHKLLEAAGAHNVNVVALLPHPTDASKKYVKDLDLNVSVNAPVDLASINVTGTPTLFMVDRNGIVERVWQGKLKEDDQNTVLSLVR